MADKGWTAQAATAVGVAAGTGAAQLGLGYGLSVVVWPTSATGGDSVWLGSLGWATWIAAGSTVFGAVAASRMRADAGPQSRTSQQSRTPQRGPWRLALSVAAAIGALLTVVLIAVPARLAQRADTFSPQTTAAAYTVAGILIGMVLAYWAVVSRPVAANIILTTAWLWGLAVAAIGHGLLTRTDPQGTHLGGWRLTGPGSGFQYGTIYWPGALLMLGAALLIGALAVWPAIRRGDREIGAAASGAAGPLLVAMTFLLLVSQARGALGELESPYLVAPYAVLTGLAGSAMMVALARGAAARRSARGPAHARPAPAAEPLVSASPAVPAVVTPAATPAAATPAATPVAAPARPGAVRATPAAVPATSGDTTGGAAAVPTGPDRPDRGGIRNWLRPGRSGGRKADDAASSAPATGRAKLPRSRSESVSAAEVAAGDAAATGAAPAPRPESSAGWTDRPPGPRTAGPAARAADPPPSVTPASVPASRPSTVTPPPATPTVAQINPPPSAVIKPAGSTADSAKAARAPRSSGRVAEQPGTPARKATRPRKSAAPPAGPADADDPDPAGSNGTPGAVYLSGG